MADFKAFLDSVGFDPRVDTKDFDAHEVCELFEVASELADQGKQEESRQWWKLVERRFNVTGIPERVASDFYTARLYDLMLNRRRELDGEASTADTTAAEDLRKQVQTWTERMLKLRVASK